MNGPLLDDLLDQLRGAPMRQLCERFHLASRDTTLRATDAALRASLTALHRLASESDGASALLGTLEFDHRGIDPSNALVNALAGGRQGAAVLAMLPDDLRMAAADQVANASGMTLGDSETLLRLLAPVLMAYLARRVFTPQETDGASTPQASPEGLRAALATEVAAFADRADDGSPRLADVGSDRPASMDDPIGPLPVQTAEMRSPRPTL